MHRFLLLNDQIVEASSSFRMSPGQVGLLAGWGVFSTIRVFNGVLFAFERHWERMKRDAALLRTPFPPDAGVIHARLLELVAANHALNATLRVVVVRNKGGMWEGPGIDRPFDLVAFTTQVKEWGKGVRLGLIPNGRHAASPFAGTKILSWSYNLAWYEEAHEKGYDEVVLLNERGEVSECTSANIFAAFGTEVRTPPLSSGCLPGITRELLLREASAAGFTVLEKTLLPADLEAADEVFITSTTRELLPVTYVEGLTIRRSGRAREALQAAFSRYVDDYVQHIDEHQRVTSAV